MWIQMNAENQNCICKGKREGRVEGSGETSVVSESTYPGEKNGLLGLDRCLISGIICGESY